ncbi:MAG: XdhC/CoxI family protein [Cyclobacterium sp.]|uniref:XdhC family protein n=1 Tax=Cyclobacterium sp. TaxID=1966343 RepID=UPI003970A77B
MKEIKEIIKAYARSRKTGEKVALATVVQVDGSSYRRPGARMLVTENGQLTGAISGGCLEGDALKKAQLVIFKKKSMLVTYDTTDEDDAKFGVGLGCNGIIHILMEPIDEEQENNPIALLQQCVNDRNDKVLVTFYDVKNKRSSQIGTCLLYNKEEYFPNLNFNQIGQSAQSFAREKSQEAIATKKSTIWPLSDGSNLHAFVEFVPAAIKLLIFGAGNDVQPLTQLAAVLGWEMTLADGRSDHATTDRFPLVDQVLSGKAIDILSQIHADRRTAVVLMTHNFNYDLEVMRGLYPYQFPYLGVLGPRKKLEKLVENLSLSGIDLNEEDQKVIFGPMGLNIGAESPEEIALSIIAEIKTVISGHNPVHLKAKKGPIHADEKGSLEP